MYTYQIFSNWPKLKTHCTFKDTSQLHITLTKSLKPMVKTYKVVAISLSFLVIPCHSLLFINLSNSLVIVLLLMLPLCGMLFQMRFVPLHPWPPSESSLKPTCHQSIPTLVWIIPWCSLWCFDPSSASGY